MAQFCKSFASVRATILLPSVFFLLVAVAGAQLAPPPAPPAAATAPAQQTPMAAPPSLSLSPAVVMARGSFGQGMSQKLTLTNQTARDFAFEMIAADVVMKDGKREFVDAGQLPRSIAATAVFVPAKGLVKAYTSQTVEVRVTVPDSTDVRAIVAIFRGVENLAQKDAAVGMTASLGTLLTFNLSDKVAVAPSVMTVEPPSATAALRVSQTLENMGAEPVLPDGVAAFLDANGKLAAKITFPQQRLLPGEKLPFVAEYPGDLRPGQYKVLCTFEFEGRTLSTEGTYTAE